MRDCICSSIVKDRLMKGVRSILGEEEMYVHKAVPLSMASSVSGIGLKHWVGVVFVEIYRIGPVIWLAEDVKWRM